MVVEIGVHDNVQAVAGSGAADSAQVVVENEVVDNSYMAVENGAVGNIQLAEESDLAEESATGHAAVRFDAEEGAAAGGSLHVRAQARALVLAIPLGKLLEKRAAMMAVTTIYFHGLSERKATSLALLMHGGRQWERPHEMRVAKIQRTAGTLNLDS